MTEQKFQKEAQNNVILQYELENLISNYGTIFLFAIFNPKID